MTFHIWFFNKNHKHHHTAMTILCFLGGIIFLTIGYFGISSSEIIALIFFTLGILSIASGFYYIMDKKRKNLETKTTYNQKS